MPYFNESKEAAEQMRTEAKHTPAPWALNGKHTVCTNDAWHHEIAVMKTVNFNHAGSNVTEEQAEANARLIAAAPELLTALQKMVWRFEAHIAELEAETGESDEAMAEALAVLAKAKGN